MFQNSGKKIMGLVKFLFGLNVAIGVLGGAAGAFEINKATSWGWGLAALCGVAGAAVFCLIMYVLLLCAYSYGELVQSNIDQRELLDKLLIKLERPAPVVHREPVAPRPQPSAEDVYGYEPVRPLPREYAKPAVEMNPTYMGGAVLRPTPAVPVKGVLPPQVQAAQPAPEAAPAVAADPAPTVVYCNKCGAKHAPDAQNCRYCGNPLH